MLRGAVGKALPGTEPIASKSAEAVLPGRRIITRACIRDVREPKRVAHAVLTCAAKSSAISLSFGRIHGTTRHSRRVYCDALPGEGSLFAALVRGRHLERLSTTGNCPMAPMAPDGKDALFFRVGPGPPDRVLRRVSRCGRNRTTPPKNQKTQKHQRIP
jgi:hypothetical protein